MPIELGIYFDKRTSQYPTFLEKNAKTKGTVFDQEHDTFLLFWICRYFTCTPSAAITAQMTPLVSTIKSGQQLALAPAFLALFYYGIFKMLQILKKDDDLSSVVAGGPIRFLNLLVLLYFPHIRQNLGAPPVIGDSRVYGGCLTRLTPAPATLVFDVAHLLATKTLTESSDFFPYPVDNAPIWPQGDSAEDKVEWFWSSILTTRLLLYGVKPKSKDKKFVVELYAPNCFARKFGFV